MTEQTISKPSRRTQTWAVSDWPQPDREAWAAACVDGDDFDDGGFAASQPPESRRSIVDAWGGLICFLDRRGELDHTAPPATRASRDNIAAYIRALEARQCAPYTVLMHLVCILFFVRGTAPDQDWSWLQIVLRRLKRRTKPTRNKRDRLVRPSQLKALGCALMDEADLELRHAASDDLPARVRSAIKYRDGLMLGVLPLRPLRRKNFTSVEIGRHLIKEGDGYRVVFPASEMKNRQDLEFAFPAGLISRLERYFTVYRPILLGQNRAHSAGFSTRLWTSSQGTPMASHAIYKQIAARTLAHFGFAINPHLIRDCVATWIAEEDPEHVFIIIRILGHTSLQTAEKHYIHARKVKALRRFSDAVEEELKQARKAARFADRDPRKIKGDKVSECRSI